MSCSCRILHHLGFYASYGVFRGSTALVYVRCKFFSVLTANRSPQMQLSLLFFIEFSALSMSATQQSFRRVFQSVDSQEERASFSHSPRSYASSFQFSQPIAHHRCSFRFFDSSGFQPSVRQPHSPSFRQVFQSADSQEERAPSSRSCT